MVSDVPHESLGTLEAPARAFLLHQYAPPWNGEKAEVGGGALGPDTTRAAIRDCTAAMRARAQMSLFTTWTGGAGPETGVGSRGGGLPR